MLCDVKVVSSSKNSLNLRVVRTRFASTLFLSFFKLPFTVTLLRRLRTVSSLFCDSCLEGAPGVPDLRSAADPGAHRTGDSTGGRADCGGATDSGAEC